MIVPSSIEDPPPPPPPSSPVQVDASAPLVKGLKDNSSAVRVHILQAAEGGVSAAKPDGPAVDAPLFTAVVKCADLSSAPSVRAAALALLAALSVRAGGVSAFSKVYGGGVDASLAEEIAQHIKNQVRAIP